MECHGQHCSDHGQHYSAHGPHASSDSCQCSCKEQNQSDIHALMWQRAAKKALMEAKKDRIRARIEKKMGASLDKGADAVVEYMHKKFTAAISTASSEQELKNKLFSILKEIS